MTDTMRKGMFARAAHRLQLHEERLALRATDRAGAVAQFAPARELVDRIATTAEQHMEALKSYLADAGENDVPAASAPSSLAAMKSAEGISGHAAGLLEDLYVDVNALSAGYASLHAAAMRRFEPRMRKLAPRHLREWAAVAQAFMVRLPDVVSLELAADGLPCCCPCPMCSIGICGCVAGATAVISDAWRETAPQAIDQPGYLLQSPRPGSQLESLGIPAGAYLLRVNGAVVPHHSAPGVQETIVPCQHGEDIQLDVLVDGVRREICVRRADTPAG
ncbi:MAG: hypothetical protein AB7T37_03740 [Dehalococcoidia bacterium]